MSERTEDVLVQVTEEGHVMVVTINRPEVRNAVNGSVHVRVSAALERANRDPSIRAIIITGAGEDAFCAGADLKAIARGENPLTDDPVQAARGFCGIVSHETDKPLIAAVNGIAMGGGAEIVLACDLAIAAETASFALPEVKRGLFAGGGGVFRLQRQIPAKVAMEMLFTGDPITAQRAFELGLVNKIVPQAQVLDAALELARRIAKNAPLGVQASKRITRGAINGTTDDAFYWQLIQGETDRLMSSEDALEGPRAFAEKRNPVWKAK